MRPTPAAGCGFLPINKPMDRKVDPHSYPNSVKTHRISGTHYHLYRGGDILLGSHGPRRVASASPREKRTFILTC